MMNNGHTDAQFYRFDFVRAVIDEMAKAVGSKTQGRNTESNDDVLKNVFGE